MGLTSNEMFEQGLVDGWNDIGYDHGLVLDSYYVAGLQQGRVEKIGAWSLANPGKPWPGGAKDGMDRK